MKKLLFTVGSVSLSGVSLTPQTVSFDRTPGTISNITGLVNDHELDIVRIKTLANLTHHSLGIWNSATPDNPKVVDGGGTAVWRGVTKPKFGKYTAANRGASGELKASKVRVKIDILDSEKASYEIETLDLDGLSFENRADYIAFVADGVTKNLAALMDANYIDIFVKDAKAKVADAVAGGGTIADVFQVVLNPNFDSATFRSANATLDARTLAAQDVYYDIAFAQPDLTKVINAYDLGSSVTQYGTLLEGKLQKVLLHTMPKGGDSATAVSKELNGFEGSTTIAGLHGAVKDHLFFNKNIETGDAGAFSTADDFLFDGVFGVMAHNESAFLAVQGIQTTGVTLPGSHNQEYVTKFNKFKGMVRDLYKVFVSKEAFGEVVVVANSADEPKETIGTQKVEAPAPATVEAGAEPQSWKEKAEALGVKADSKDYNKNAIKALWKAKK